VRYPCLSAFIERRQDCLGEGKVCRLDTVLGDGQRGRLSLASSLNVDQGHGTIELHGDHEDESHGASQEFHADQSYFTKRSLSSGKSVATMKILSAYRIREVEDLGHSVLVNYVETKF